MNGKDMNPYYLDFYIDAIQGFQVITSISPPNFLIVWTSILTLVIASSYQQDYLRQTFLLSGLLY